MKNQILFCLWKAKDFISLFDYTQKQGSSYSQPKALAPEASDVSNLSALLKRRLDKRRHQTSLLKTLGLQLFELML